MSKGRQVRILGKRMVINLNTKGGVRKSPGANARAKCIAIEKVDFHNSKCKGQKGKTYKGQ